MRKMYHSLIRLTEKYYWILFVLLTAVIAFLCFRCLGIKTIDSWDEARHGVSAYEMMQSGNYIVNTFAGETDYWNVKPPLSFWSIVLGFSLFGYNAVGLRFFSALAYLLTSILTGLFARRYSKLTSLLTMIFLAANYYPFKAHLVRAGDADSLYLLFFTIAMISMLKIKENQRWLYVCGLCFSLGFLTKSFHAGMIAAAGGLFLFLTGELKRMNPRVWAGFAASALLPALIWVILRYQYDGTAFFVEMYQADIAGRTAAGGLEGHGAPFTFYWNSIFWDFDYIYGFLTVIAILGLLYLWFRPLRPKDTPLPAQDLTGILLWFGVPLLGFSLVSTKLMWYVYPCIVPLCLLAAVFLARYLETDPFPSGILLLSMIWTGSLTCNFIWSNYSDNVRGAHSNDLQTFVIEQFSREDDLTGFTIYLDAYDPFLYANTTEWEQNMRLLAMMEGDLNCTDGGAEHFLADEQEALLILSVPFLENYPELSEYNILADNGQYLLIQK